MRGVVAEQLYFSGSYWLVLMCFLSRKIAYRGRLLLKWAMMLVPVCIVLITALRCCSMILVEKKASDMFFHIHTAPFLT
jgi:hypothetical protein